MVGVRSVPRPPRRRSLGRAGGGSGGGGRRRPGAPSLRLYRRPSLGLSLSLPRHLRRPRPAPRAVTSGDSALAPFAAPAPAHARPSDADPSVGGRGAGVGAGGAEARRGPEGGPFPRQLRARGWGRARGSEEQASVERLTMLPAKPRNPASPGEWGARGERHKTAGAAPLPLRPVPTLAGSLFEEGNLWPGNLMPSLLSLETLGYFKGYSPLSSCRQMTPSVLS